MEKNMENKRYIISEASAKTGLEPHVLRYWEDELGIEIERNELGHRYYSAQQLELLSKVKEMKQRGFQLKAIKSELLGSNEVAIVEKVSPDENKLEQFKAIIGSIVTQSLRENNVVLGGEISDTVSTKVLKEMDYLMRMREEAEEERYKRLDETIRSCQRSNKEAAVMKEPKFKRKRRKLAIK
jgi:DNA-binding transcriptional MerR regulator